MIGRAQLKRRWLIWLAAAVLVAVVAVPFVRLGFVFLGRALSPSAPPDTYYSSWPANGEVVGTLTPTLRWPSTDTSGYVVDIYELDDGDIRWANSLATVSDQLAIPDGLLEGDHEYYWSVSADRPDGLEPLYAGRFSTAMRVQVPGITVAPAVFRVNVDSLLNGLELVVETDGSSDVQLILPEGLTASGKSKVSGVGSFSVRVRPSVQFFEMQASADDPTLLEQIVIRFGEAKLDIPVRVDVSNVGQLQRVVKTRFEPALDTPAFANFADGLLAKITRGTCLGMVLSVNETFLRRVSCQDDPTLSCMPMRIRSLVNPEAEKKRMSYLHLANLDPQNWSLALTSVVGEDSQYGVWNELLADLTKGAPVVVAVISPAEQAKEAADNMGHAVLVYAAHVFDDYLIFHIYDPDMIYRKGAVNETFLVVKRDGSWHGSVLYASSDGLDRVEIFKVPEPSIVKLLSPLASAPYTALDRGLANRLR